MPTVTNNLLLQGLSGKLGSMVLRQLNGKTIVQAAPVRKKPATPAELANRELFRQAVAYAKETSLHPERWEIYVAEARRRGGTSNAFAVAVSDFRKGLTLRKAATGTKPQKQPENRKTAAGAFRLIAEPVSYQVKVWKPALPEAYQGSQIHRLKRFGLGRAGLFP